MPLKSQTPNLSDLYHLGNRIDQDNSASLEELRHRDHAIGLECKASDDVGRLLFWLRKLPEQRGEGPEDAEHYLTESTVATLSRIVALVLGITGMSGFLLASGQGLVNVFVFLLFFVFLQVISCMFSIWVMYRSMRGSPPVILPINPAKLIVSRMFPDKRFFRECQSVIRLLILRYGQEMGAIFTVGAVLAFFIVLAFSDFTFVWGSTFSLSGNFVKGFADFLSAPWLSTIPATGVTMETVVASRYHPALTDFGKADIASNRWWPFLVMSMFFYALLPRLALWVTSKYLYSRSISRSFTTYPGAERILSRMKSPIISTQGDNSAIRGGHNSSDIAFDQKVMLIDWAGALDTASGELFEEIQGVSPESIMVAGIGSIADDAEFVKSILRKKPERLLVVVKAWEPPMSDLRDFISSLDGVARCTLCLLPLRNKVVSAASNNDWRAFSRDLALDVVDVIVLERHKATKV